MNATTIRMNAKCSDLCYMSLEDNKGERLAERDGYVPDFMPGEHYGDYVELDIDLATGQIKNWKVPSKADLKKAFPEAKII